MSDIQTRPPSHIVDRIGEQQSNSVVMELDVLNPSEAGSLQGDKATLGCKQLEGETSDMQIIEVNTASQ